MSKQIVNPNPFGKSGKDNGLWFFYDDDISIYWNRSHTFNVWNNGKEVNCFTVMETMTPKQAEKQADEWLEHEQEEEKLRHADDMEFQFESPDLFKM
jgi:hypothetical protein